MKKLLLVAAVVFVMPVFSASAQEQQGNAVVSVAEEQQPEMDVQFSFGTVVSATPTDLVVSEYNYDTDANVDVSYSFNEKTVFENVTSASELQQADEVDIDYKEVNGKKVIVRLSKVKIEDVENTEADEAVAPVDETQEPVMKKEEMPNSSAVQGQPQNEIPQQQ